MTYAGFWRRFAAMLIDALIILIPGLLFGKAMPYVGEIVVGLLYFPIFEASRAQATPGKYVMGIKVVQENGQGLTLWRAFTRYIGKYVSAFVLLLGYVMQIFTAKRQTLHDMIAGAVVVRHNYATAPDWAGAWMSVMRYLLRVDPKPASETIIDVDSTTPNTSENPTPVAPETPSHTHAEALESIEKLHELYKQGALSEDEYQSKKSELLKQV